MRLQGRAREADALARCLHLAAEGTGQVAFVEGEAGIGKTRLVAETVAAAEDRGFLACQARAEELERARPFGALADALGCERRSLDPARAALGRLITGEVEEADDGVALQFRAVEAFVELLERLTGAGLALEDLHWADLSTLLTVRSMTRRLAHAPLLLLGTFRPAPSRSDLDRLVETCADQGATRLRLAPLEQDAVAALVAEAAGTAPGPRLRRQLDGAGGNPLFVLELIKSLTERGALDFAQGYVEAAEVALPATLRLTILRRLSGLSEGTLELLRLASILGSTLSLADLSMVAHRPAVDLLPALREALRAGLLGEADAQLAFRHELVREAIYTDLPLPVRQGLHHEVGQALAAIGAPAVRVATHLALGASEGDTEAVEWLRRAARQAAPRAPGVAAELLARAIELVDRADPKRDRLCVEQVDALGWAGRLRDSEELAREVLDRCHDPSVEGELRLHLSRALLMRARARDALAVIATTEPAALTDAQRVQLQAIAAWARTACGDLDAALAIATSARSDAERIGDEAAWCIAAAAVVIVGIYRGEVDEAVRMAAEVAVRVDRSPAGDARRMTCHHTLVLCLVEADRFSEAEDAVLRYRGAAEAVGGMWSLPRLYLTSTTRRFFAGEWDDAIAECETVLTMDRGGSIVHPSRAAGSRSSPSTEAGSARRMGI